VGRDVQSDNPCHSDPALPPELLTIPGLDAPLALERFSGHTVAYLRRLQRFLNEGPGLLADVRTLVAGDEPEALRFRAHAIKGTAGNLGFTGLFEKAGDLESAAVRGGAGERQAAGDALEAAFQSIRPVLSPLLERILAALDPALASTGTDLAGLSTTPGSPTLPASGEADERPLTDVLGPLAELADHVRERRFTAAPCLETIRHGWERRLAGFPEFGELTERVPRFAFPEALDLIQRLAERIRQASTTRTEDTP